jgi:hypothetical protein
VRSPFLQLLYNIFHLSLSFILEILVAKGDPGDHKTSPYKAQEIHQGTQEKAELLWRIFHSSPSGMQLQ